ncbi:MAG: SH3 domain-containing protein [Pseudomonadota bacterium]
MWRFMLVTFGFLAIAFYHLSGGADYEPSDNSIQAHKAQPSPVKVSTLNASGGAEEAINAPLINPPKEPFTNAVKREVTLISIDNSEEQSSPAFKSERIEVSFDEAEVEAAIEQIKDLQDLNAQGAIAIFSQQEEELVLRTKQVVETPPVASTSQDLRYVIGDIVNMRSGPGVQYAKISALTEGTLVDVLRAPGNGWLELQVITTGQTGWMADWLISPSEVSQVAAQ